MKTTARFDRDSQTFDLHTPSPDGVKTWLVSGSRRCTHAVVFAQVPAADAIRVFVCQVSSVDISLRFWWARDHVDGVLGRWCSVSPPGLVAPTFSARRSHVCLCEYCSATSACLFHILCPASPPPLCRRSDSLMGTHVTGWTSVPWVRCTRTQTGELRHIGPHLTEPLDHSIPCSRCARVSGAHNYLYVRVEGAVDGETERRMER
jgi:hypothetical protein